MSIVEQLQAAAKVVRRYNHFKEARIIEEGAREIERLQADITTYIKIANEEANK